MSDDIPQFGDPELLPKPKLVRPTRRRMPYDASGRLKPNGPEFTEPPGPQPDIAGLPWKRIGFNSWTSEAQRTIVKDFIREFFADNFPTFNQWEVIEINSGQRQSVLKLPAPILRIRVMRKEDGAWFEVAVSFEEASRTDLSAFASRLALAGPSLLAQASG